MYGVIKYIDEHIEEKLTLDKVADYAGYSKWHFCSVFKRFTGKSFIDYINDKKMQYAANDIIRGEKVTDVAYKYGFDTGGGFNKAFLKKFGCYPTQFKKLDNEFHVRYKERKEGMFKLSDRSAILKEEELKQTLTLKIGMRTRYYLAQGEASVKDGADNNEIIAAGVCNVIEKLPTYIQDGELIVGCNFGYESRYSVWDVPNAGKRLKDEGFTDSEIEDFFNVTKTQKLIKPKSVEYSACERHMEDEWAAIGRPMISDHSVLDYDLVLKKGFSGLYKMVEEYEKKNGTSTMYTACKRICKSAEILGERYKKEVEKILEKGGLTSEREIELLKMKEVLNNVPKNPARNLHEAIQSLVFAHFIATWEDSYVNANSLGRLDQILYPYYVRDIESGMLTKEQAFELICGLWLKLYRDYDVQQSVVGGCTPDGKDAVNELSYMMLDATEVLDFVRCLSVRYDKNTSPAFIKRALEVVGHSQKGVPFFFNDEVMIQSLVGVGVKLEDARDYTQIGCVETVIPGKSNPHAVAGETNLLKAIEYVLNENKSLYSDSEVVGVTTPKVSQLKSYNAVKNAVFSHVKNLLEITCKKVVEHTKAHEKVSYRPYKSLLTKGCLENNKDFNDRGALYDYYQVMFCGVPNLADSLIAIKKLVFEENKYTLEQLVNQIKNDFPDESIRLDFLNNAPKFGNDVDEVDYLASEIIDFGCEVLKEQTEKYGYTFHAQPFTYKWLIEHGKFTCATPDGRRKGENIAYSVSPMQGRDFSGLTAVFNSITKLPTTKTPGTTSAIIEVDPHLFTDRNLDVLAQMMLAVAEKGLSNVQYNITDAKTLMDAKKHPEKYPNLAVRVSGFSQKFYLLNDELQDHIIERTKHKCL